MQGILMGPLLICIGRIIYTILNVASPSTDERDNSFTPATRLTNRWTSMLRQLTTPGFSGSDRSTASADTPADTRAGLLGLFSPDTAARAARGADQADAARTGQRISFQDHRDQDLDASRTPLPARAIGAFGSQNSLHVTGRTSAATDDPVGFTGGILKSSTETSEIRRREKDKRHAVFDLPDSASTELGQPSRPAARPAVSENSGTSSFGSPLSPGGSMA